MNPHRFSVNCGDWIYPSKDSSCGVQYPLSYAWVVEIFVPTKDKRKKISPLSGIKNHLSGPRFLEIRIVDHNSLIVEYLKNHHEEDFSRTIDFTLKFNPATLARSDFLWPFGFERTPTECVFSAPLGINQNDWNAVFFTSILLQTKLKGRPLPAGINFRDATIPEIESLGSWNLSRKITNSDDFL
ncbi:MAG TPA: hypothetical protein PJ997_01965 [Candidatus Paceibacterota bacterium]|nr:hypothetical protein [Candidatus Paceibacterota bacterium]HMP19081.1 hypothetical protein [Candidatus Paceibacterota bacterium]HMP85473.1 hypothetical protein [Candidatus Paceibacterota bacterium]